MATWTVIDTIPATLGSADGSSVTGVDSSSWNGPILVWASWYGAINTPTLSDSQGGNSNTYVPLTSTITTANGNRSGRWFYCLSPAHVGSGHQWALNGLNTYSAFAVVALSPSQAASLLDLEVTAVSNSTSSLALGSNSPAFTDEILLLGASGAVGTPGLTWSGATLDEQVVLNAGSNCTALVAHKIQTSIAAENPTVTQTSGELAMQLISLKSTSSGAGGGGGTAAPVFFSHLQQQGMA